MVELTTIDVIMLLIVGLVGGGFGGLLGIGGSIIFIPMLDQIFAGRLSQTPGIYNLWAATALVCNVFVGGGAAVSHWRNKRIIKRAVLMIVPLGVAGALIGVGARLAVSQVVLWIILGIVVLYMALRNASKLWKGQESKAIDSDQECHLPKLSWPRMTLVGGVTGFLSGILGIGGGVYSVPSQQLLLDMPQKNAIANSASTMPVFCGIAGLLSVLALPDELRMTALLLAGVLVPAALAGAYLGGHLTHHTPDKLVRLVFIAILLWTAYKGLLVKTGLV